MGTAVRSGCCCGALVASTSPVACTAATAQLIETHSDRGPLTYVLRDPEGGLSFLSSGSRRRLSDLGSHAERDLPDPVPDGVMRIAVKDAIDVAGVVTTAGCVAVRDRACSPWPPPAGHRPGRTCPGEGQVLRLLADGMSVGGIVKQLFVSGSTPKAHIS